MVQVGAVLPVFDLYTTAAPPPVGVGPILGVALLSSPVADSLQLVASLDGSFLAMVGARRLVVGGIVGGRVHPFAGRGWYAQAGLGVVVTREWIAMDVGPRSFRSRDGGAGLAGDAVVGWSADRFEVSIAWRQRLASSFEGAAQGALALRLGWLL